VKGVNDLGDCNDCVVCRCEDVKLSEILHAIHEDDAVSPQEVKMLTRAGMGICGGRVCRNVVSRVVAAETGIAVETLGLDSLATSGSPDAAGRGGRSFGGRYLCRE